MKNKTNNIIFMTIIVIMLFAQLKAQNPNWPFFNLDLRNDTMVAPNVYEFDIYLMHTGNFITPVQFVMSSIQCGIYINGDFFNGGTVIPTVVPGTQNDLQTWQWQTNANLAVSGTPNSIMKTIIIRFVPNMQLQPGSLIKNILQGGSRIMRLRLTNNVYFNTLVNPDLHFSFDPYPSWPTTVSAYIGTTPYSINPNGTFTNSTTVYNPPIDPVMTGGGMYCQSGAYVPVGISFSSPICNFQLQKDGGNYGPEVPGTGGPLTWYVNEAGNYKCLAGLFSITGTSVVVDGIPPKPIGDTVQSFCQGAKIIDLAITGNNIKWYDAQIGGNILYNLSNLADGTTYWASQTNGTCEGKDRLGVKIALTITPPPDALCLQAFCNSTTISNLAISGTELRWYTASTGGTELPTNTIITNDTIFYASQTLNGCESFNRQLILVTIGNVPAGPPMGDSIQYFCTFATVGNIHLYNSTPIVHWYDANTGGNLLSPSQELVNGQTYYVKSVNGCESVDGLPVKVFYTRNSVQTATILLVNNIQQSSANFNSSISSTCAGPVTSNGYLYARHPHPMFSDSSSFKKISGSGVGNFSTVVTGLLSNTYYWVKAYTILGGDTTYSQETSFNTYQWPFFNLEIKNAYATDNSHFEFDIYMVYRGSNSIPAQLELADIQLGVYFNSSILNGGNPTVSIVSGTQSNINLAQRQTNADISVVGPAMGLKTIKIKPKTVASGSGTIFTSSIYNKRIMRVRLTNSVQFYDGTSFLSFSRTDADSSFPCIVRAYIGNVATNININQTSYTYYNNKTYFGVSSPPPFLDGHGIAPIVIQNPTHSLKGGGVYCPNGTPVMIYMDSTIIGGDYILRRKNSSDYYTGHGWGKSMAWFVTEPGEYTCSYTYLMGSTIYLPDSVVVTSGDPGMPVGSTPQSICPSASISSLAVSGSNIKWYDAPVWGNMLSMSQALVGGSTYYASQKPGGCESKDRLGITYFNSRSLNVKAYLEGLFDNNTNMLREAVDGNTGLPKWGVGIADKIDLELHQATAPYASVCSENNLALATNGIVTSAMPCADSSDYYIAIKNRNHLQTWSAVPVPFNNQNITYDFTMDAMQAYGLNGQVQVAPNVWAFYLGDIDHGGWVDALDFNMFEPDLTAGSVGFYDADFDGGGWVDALDFNLFEPRLTEGVSSQWPGK